MGHIWVPEAVVVCFVLHDGVCWKVQDSSQSVSNSGRRHLVVGCSVPDGQDVLLSRERERRTQQRQKTGVGQLLVSMILVHSHTAEVLKPQWMMKQSQLLRNGAADTLAISLY